MQPVRVTLIVLTAAALALTGCSSNARAPESTSEQAGAPAAAGSSSAGTGGQPSSGGTSAATQQPDQSRSGRQPSEQSGKQQLRPVTTEKVMAKNLEAPWSVVFLGQDPLISERDSGRILQLKTDGSTVQVGTVPDVVSSSGAEGGLLGLAVDSERRLYAYSTGPDGNRIQRYQIRGNSGHYSLGPATTLLDGLKAATHHNGGRLAFGPDGMLYATVGDAEGGDVAQDRNALNGKILRMTPDGKVPAGNPFGDSYVYSMGHRNPQGLAWAPDGTLYASEFGQDTWDELNVITPGSNYGWPIVEGKAGDQRFKDPVQQWHPADASPSGITIHEDTIYMAALRGQRLISIPLRDTGTSTVSETDSGRLRQAVTTPGGAVWILTNNTDSRGTPRPGDDKLIAIPAP